MRENAYQADLIKRLRKEFPGCVILKNDSGYMQGIPDLSVFYGPYWFMLEVKSSADEVPGPNQEYYINLLNTLSFAAFIYPENEEDVIYALQQSFGSGR